MWHIHQCSYIYTCMDWSNKEEIQTHWSRLPQQHQLDWIKSRISWMYWVDRTMWDNGSQVWKNSDWGNMCLCRIIPGIYYSMVELSNISENPVDCHYKSIKIIIIYLRHHPEKGNCTVDNKTSKGYIYRNRCATNWYIEQGWHN